MRKPINKILKGLLTILPIAAAVLVVAYLVTHKPGPARKTGEESIRTLRIIEAPSVDLVPRAVGYGVAEPGWVWEAVAEVRGTVSSIHPRLKSGELIGAKSVLIQIDPTEVKGMRGMPGVFISSIRRDIMNINKRHILCAWRRYTKVFT